jgi:DNA-binding response OmpR family regulator
MGNRVLIADDEEIVRSALIEILLAGAGVAEADEAADGAAALEKARASSYDLVVTDLKMPRMDGLELLSALRRELPCLPVIIVTAMREEESVIRSLAEGAWDYILKPFRPEHIVAAVRRAIAAGGSQNQGMLRVVADGVGRLELTASSENEHLWRFRDFTQLLLRSSLAPEQREEIRFAVEELGRNAIEWGNRGDPAKRVRLAYQLLPDRIVFEIEDEGEGFLPEAVADPFEDIFGHALRRRREGKRAGGYGIHLVRKLMDEVRYNEKGNAVVMTKYLR